MIIKFFPRAILKDAAIQGAKVGYNRSFASVDVAKEFGEEVDQSSWINFPVMFSMHHRHINGELVDPHIRTFINMGPKASDLQLDVSQELYEMLPTFDTEIIKEDTIAMGQIKELLAEAEEQLRTEYFEMHPNASTKELDEAVPCDAVYERAQDILDSIGDHKADIKMGK